MEEPSDSYHLASPKDMNTSQSMAVQNHYKADILLSFLYKGGNRKRREKTIRLLCPMMSMRIVLATR